jgi:hypothetical protein
VVGEREQLDAGRGGSRDDLGGRQGTVGVARVALEIKCGRRFRQAREASVSPSPRHLRRAEAMIGR